MNGLLLPGLLVLALVLILLAWRARRARSVSCSLQETLMTPDRHREFEALQALLQEEVRLFTHVRLKDVLLPGKGVGKGKWQKQLASMGDRQFDYLLCHPEDLSLICAIERLAPAQGKRRPSRDRWLQQLCERADLPLLPLTGQEAADLDELKEQVQALLLDEEALDPQTALTGGKARADLQPASPRRSGSGRDTQAAYSAPGRCCAWAHQQRGWSPSLPGGRGR